MEVLSPEAYFVKGGELLRDGKLNQACKNFYKAYREEKDKPEYLSYYGMCAATSRGEIKLGLELCTRAIKKEFYKPEYYENLAKVYLASGNKKGAITTLKKGIKYETKGEILHNMLVSLGVRHKPVFPFLRRTNPVNMVFGVMVRHTIPQMFRRRRPVKKST